MPGPFIALLPRSSAGFGWTSVYYPTAIDHDSALTAADNINTLEMGLLPGAVVSGLLRVSDMTVHGDVKILEPTTPIGTYGPPPPAPAEGCVDPNIALGIKFEAGVLNRATKYLRGLPVSLYTHLTRGAFTPDTNWAAAMVLYSAGVENKFSVMTRQGGPPPILTPHVITNCILFLAARPAYTSIRRAGRPFDLPRGRARAG